MPESPSNHNAEKKERIIPDPPQRRQENERGGIKLKKEGA